MEDQSVDVIWADPPYFLSGGGPTCKSGKRASVDKGKWDKPKSPEAQLLWTQRWLMEGQRILKPTGTVWVCGTLHSVHSVGYALQILQMRLLNNVVWVKGNPPPNLGCRTLTHSHESILWASQGKKAKHHFDYQRMKELHGGTQMKDVWQFNAPTKAEKIYGKHPTQKPIDLVDWCLLASLPEGGVVIDPFCGGGTTGVAVAKRPKRNCKFIGIELETEWCELARKRILDAITPEVSAAAE